MIIMYYPGVYIKGNMMIRTQIYLTEEERAELVEFARKSGRKQSELIREAIDLFLERKKSAHRQAVLDRMAGMWRNRKDLPDFKKLRSEWDRIGA